MREVGGAIGRERGRAFVTGIGQYLGICDRGMSHPGDGIRMLCLCVRAAGKEISSVLGNKKPNTLGWK